MTQTRKHKEKEKTTLFSDPCREIVSQMIYFRLTTS